MDKWDIQVLDAKIAADLSDGRATGDPPSSVATRRTVHEARQELAAVTSLVASLNRHFETIKMQLAIAVILLAYIAFRA